jgi:hypothetical protein
MKEKKKLTTEDLDAGMSNYFGTDAAAAAPAACEAKVLSLYVKILFC